MLLDLPSYFVAGIVYRSVSSLFSGYLHAFESLHIIDILIVRLLRFLRSWHLLARPFALLEKGPCITHDNGVCACFGPRLAHEGEVGIGAHADGIIEVRDFHVAIVKERADLGSDLIAVLIEAIIVTTTRARRRFGIRRCGAFERIYGR